MYIYLYIYFYICVCVCMTARVMIITPLAEYGWLAAISSAFSSVCEISVHHKTQETELQKQNCQSVKPLLIKVCIRSSSSRSSGVLYASNSLKSKKSKATTENSQREVRRIWSPFSLFFTNVMRGASASSIGLRQPKNCPCKSSQDPATRKKLLLLSTAETKI